MIKSKGGSLYSVIRLNTADGGFLYRLNYNNGN